MLMVARHMIIKQSNLCADKSASWLRQSLHRRCREVMLALKDVAELSQPLMELTASCFCMGSREEEMDERVTGGKHY